MKNKTVVTLIVGFIIVGIYFLVSSNIGIDNSFVTKIDEKLPSSTKNFLKETIFVFKNQKLLKEKLKVKDKGLADKDKLLTNVKFSLETKVRELLLPIKFSLIESKILKLNDKEINFQKFKTNDLAASIWKQLGGSSYLDFYDDNLFIASSTGIFGYTNKFDNENIKFKQIPSNIKDIITYEAFYLNGAFSIKDLLIYKNKFYISYIKQVRNNCYNTSILFADLNYEKMIFENFFSYKECVKTNNEDNAFKAIQSGGRIVPYKDNKLLFGVGDYRLRKNAQVKSNFFGKIISINTNSKNVEIISMGHRNPQGLIYDVDNNTIILTEHGPQGGDEINLNKNPGGKIENFGWAISSYGEHYGGKILENKKIYEKYPLYKSHKDYGFIEPLKYYVPAIGISEIIKIGPNFLSDETNQILVSSLIGKSIYHYILDKDFSILKENKVSLEERIRDMLYVKKINKVFLFLESSGSIGIMTLMDK